MVAVAYFGDDDWSLPALQRLLDNPDVDVRVVVERARPSSPSLAQLAHQAGVTVLTTSNVNRAAFADMYRPLGIELGISNSYDQIFGPELIAAHPLGIINCHSALLPRYRGRNALTWAMIAGEPTVGVTVHQVNKGVDTGAILVQVAVPVGPEDQFGTIRHRIGVAGAVAIAEAVHQITTGTTDPIPQTTLSPGFTVARRGPGDETINWRTTARQVHDFVRALTPPGPSARTTGSDGTAWAITHTKLPTGDRPGVGRPGTVLARDDQGFLVACADSAIWVLAGVADDDMAVNSRPPVGYRFTAPGEMPTPADTAPAM